VFSATSIDWIFVDNAATVEQKTAETSDRSSDASKYILPWKIRRVKKHKLDRMQAPPSSSSSLREGQRHRHSARYSAAVAIQPVMDS